MDDLFFKHHFFLQIKKDLSNNLLNYIENDTGNIEDNLRSFERVQEMVYYQLESGKIMLEEKKMFKNLKECCKKETINDQMSIMKSIIQKKMSTEEKNKAWDSFAQSLEKNTI